MEEIIPKTNNLKEVFELLGIKEPEVNIDKEDIELFKQHPLFQKEISIDEKSFPIPTQEFLNMKISLYEEFLK